MIFGSILTRHRLFSHKPGAEYIGFKAVSLELWIVFVLRFEQRHSRHEANKHCDEERCENSNPSPLNGASNDPYPPPKYSFSPVIRVSRVPPKAPHDELLFAWSFVCQMHRKLLVSNRFEQESKEPNSSTDIIRPKQSVIIRVNRNVKCCRVYDQGENCLEHENIEEELSVEPTLTVN